MSRQRRIVEVILAVAALAAAAGCGGSGAPDKAGGEGTPLVLRLGTQDRSDLPGGKLASHFADEVRRRSGGSLRVSVTYEVAGRGSRWDQKVAELVRSGRLDLALVPSRAWDVEGVRSMRALQTPFILQTAEQVRRALSDPSVAATMLSGLRPLGVTGLGLIPESLRHPFAVHGALRSLQDFAGAVIRAPRSDMTWALLRALGARPVDLDGPPYTSALRRGTVTAAESDLALASPAPPAPATATGNITFFPLVDVIVANSRTLARLSSRDRDILRRAAADTAAWAPSSLLSDSDAGREFCKDGGRVVNASPHDLAALTAAARPVTTELERDPGYPRADRQDPQGHRRRPIRADCDSADVRTAAGLRVRERHRRRAGRRRSTGSTATRSPSTNSWRPASTGRGRSRVQTASTPSRCTTGARSTRSAASHRHVARATPCRDTRSGSRSTRHPVATVTSPPPGR